jgi:uncharacterized protein YfdQ (DUF2303 family)
MTDDTHDTDTAGAGNRVVGSTGDLIDVIDAAQEAVAPHPLEAGDLFAVTTPSGARTTIFDLERKLPNPHRKKGTVKLHTQDALARYVGTHHEGDATTLYGDLDLATVTAVLNGHQVRSAGEEGNGGAAGWGDHRAVLTLRETKSWAAWTAIDGKALDQTTFAQFVEDHTLDVVEPNGATVLELAKTFEATTSVNFASAVRLDNGQRQLTYQETTTARAGQNGAMQVPDEIVLGLKPWLGTPEPYKVVARLRYNVREGHLKIGVSLLRLDLIIESAFGDVLEDIAGACGYAPLRGEAP